MHEMRPTELRLAQRAIGKMRLHRPVKGAEGFQRLDQPSHAVMGRNFRGHNFARDGFVQPVGHMPPHRKHGKGQLAGGHLKQLGLLLRIACHRKLNPLRQVIEHPAEAPIARILDPGHIKCLKAAKCGLNDGVAIWHW